MAQHDPRLAAALHRALVPGRSPEPPSPARVVSDAAPQLVRSFTGALRLSSDEQVACLVALLELATFRQAMLLAAPSPRARRRALERFEARLARRVRELQNEDPMVLRQRLVQAMRLRLNGRRAAAPAPPGLDALLVELCQALGQMYGIPERWPHLDRFQTVACAASHEVAGCPTLPACVQHLARRTAARVASAAGALAGACALAYAGRHRLALTLTTLAYVLFSSLFGLTLAFEVYRWMAVAIEALALPPALFTYVAAGSGLVYVRQRRRFDLQLLALVQASLYGGGPPPGRGPAPARTHMHPGRPA